MFAKGTKASNLWLLFWGQYGTGKTYLALQMPKVCMIATDREGAHQENFGQAIFHVNSSDDDSFERINEALTFLKTQKHDFETLVIDSASTVWDMVVDSYMRQVQKDNIAIWEWRIIKNNWMRFLGMLRDLDMNIVFTVREAYKQEEEEKKSQYEKTKYNEVPRMAIEVKKTLYEFDVILHLTRDEYQNRLAITEKHRHSPFEKSLPDKFVPDFSYIEKILNPIPDNEKVKWYEENFAKWCNKPFPIAKANIIKDGEMYESFTWNQIREADTMTDSNGKEYTNPRQYLRILANDRNVYHTDLHLKSKAAANIFKEQEEQSDLFDNTPNTAEHKDPAEVSA